MVEPTPPLSAVVLDREGRLLDAGIAADEQARFPPGAGVPERFAVALTAFEDRRFWWHPGVDPIAVARATRDNLAARRVVSGASTLTMQLVRLSRSNPPRTLSEKLIEAVLALRLDLALPKQEILARYAANAPFGGNTVGLEAAAWRTFGRAPGELSWAEAATLAVLPNSPGLIHPGRNRDALLAKRDRLLRALRDAGHLDDRALELALAEPLPGPPRRFPSLAPHLVAQVASDVGRGGPARVVTTLDGALQRRAAEVLARHQRRLAGDRIDDLAAVIVDLPTGEVLAYLGNAATGAGAEHVDLVRARRSTGSLLKPFLYAALLEAGELLPHEVIEDTPLRIGGFAPENYDRQYLGAIPASEALARSRNVPAVRLLQRYGLERFAARLRTLGMSTLHRPARDYGLTLVLGGAEGTLWELTSLYRRLALAAAGEGAAPVHWRVGASGVVEPDPPAFDAGAAWWTLEALEEVNRPGLQSAWRSLAGTRRVAWKTGTSFGFRDAWAIGVTPRVAVGVWAGNAAGDGRPHLTGHEAAAPVLFELIELVEGGPWFEAPAGALVEVEVCAVSGMRAGPDCGSTRPERVPRAALRGRGCSWCTRIHLDAAGRRVHAGCERPSAMRAQPWFVMPPEVEWLTARHRTDLPALPPWRADCEPADAGGLSVVVPAEGAVIAVPVELDGRVGRVVFRAVHRDPRAEIYWHLDASYLGVTTTLHELALAPAAGPHVLTLVDRSGARVERRFTVAR